MAFFGPPARRAASPIFKRASTAPSSSLWSVNLCPKGNVKSLLKLGRRPVERGRQGVIRDQAVETCDLSAVPKHEHGRNTLDHEAFGHRHVAVDVDSIHTEPTLILLSHALQAWLEPPTWRTTRPVEVERALQTWPQVRSLSSSNPCPRI